MKFELTDDNLLRLNATMNATHGAWSFAHPKSYHDAMYGSIVPYNAVKDRWHGLAVASIAALNFAVAEGKGIGAGDVKKNALLANGAIWGVAALNQGYNISAGKQKNEPAMVANVVALAAMSAVNIWKGAGGKDKKAKASVK